MFRKQRYYKLSSDSLRLEEVHHVGARLAGAVAAGALVLGLLVVGGNPLLRETLGLGPDRVAALTVENEILRSELRALADRMESTRSAIEHLAGQGDNLRLMVDLRTIDEETRRASAGGSVEQAQFNFLSGEAREVLDRAQGVLEDLGREVKLQQASYEEIQKRFEFNRKFFACLPALKPMEGVYSVDGFGMRVHPVLGVYKMHEGVDIINDDGTPVYASGDGVVRYSGRTMGGYGTVIEIDHGYGYASLYAHLSATLVKEGSRVRRGELIARSGRSGLVSGPHLHYEVRHSGRKLNPVDFFFDDVDAARYRTLLAQAR